MTVFWVKRMNRRKKDKRSGQKGCGTGSGKSNERDAVRSCRTCSYRSIRILQEGTDPQSDGALYEQFLKKKQVRPMTQTADRYGKVLYDLRVPQKMWNR